MLKARSPIHASFDNRTQMMTRIESRRLTARVFRGMGLAGPATTVLTLHILDEIGLDFSMLFWMGVATPFCSIAAGSAIDPVCSSWRDRMNLTLSYCGIAVGLWLCILCLVGPSLLL